MAATRPTALVTGSASGIGKAAALRLARGGYDVAINYSRSAGRAHEAVAELEGLGVDAMALQAEIGRASCRERV